ncbi:hypothetical protein [Amycolatopsis vastitatis]|nr:hypothetical protein [Amycolatopsis vastitatis]
MTSRLRAAVVTLFVVLSLAFAVDGITITTVSAGPDCVRPCHF